VNRRLRVLAIGRHFWPLGANDSAAHLMELATDLSRSGLHLEVLTPSWSNAQPKRFVFREFTVHRPIAAPRFDGAFVRDWSVNRYLRLLAGWIRDTGTSFDVLIADTAREEAVAAMDAAKSLGCATVVRLGGWDQDGDLAWWQAHRTAGRCLAAVRRADAVIVKTSTEHRELIARGFRSNQLHRIEPGFASATVRSESAKLEARRVLAATNADLAAPLDMPVIVCCAPLNDDPGIRMLIESVRVLVSRFPGLRFWFIGDGPYRDSYYDYLRGEGVRDAIALPGSFTDMQEILAAADLYVQTNGGGLDSFLRQAVAADLPVVSVDTAATRAVLAVPQQDAAAEWVTWYQPHQIKSLRLAVRSVLENRLPCLERAQHLRRHLARQRPRQASVQAYVKLISLLAARRSAVHHRPLSDDSSFETAS